ncbi:hypothetical protein C0993_009908 [Termitomyces sp. T159_Od127]|nr:hypothetical protein C0993_009908 [Termitomyces sp. T159_Od127]
MARYQDNLGAEWLAPFTNNFAPPAPSFDEELEALLAGEEPLVVSMAAKGKAAVIALLVEQDLQNQEQFWQDVARESAVDAQRRIANSLKAVALEGLGLGEATGAGEGSWQRPEEEEGAREMTPDTTAGAAIEAASPAARKAPAGGAKGLASPAKKGSPTKPSSKRRGCPAPRYKAPTQQDFSDKELACLLVPRWAEAVVDTGVEARVVLKETKGKATVDLATCQAFKEERGVCDKCWADNDPEGCWYPTQEHGNTLNPTVEKTYHQAVLVRRAQAVVEKAREAKAQGEVVGISKRSLALPTCHGSEERGSGKDKRKASPHLSPTDKGKKRVRVVSPAVGTPELGSDKDDEDEACRLGTAIEASKAVPGTEDLAGPSCQAEAAQDVGALPERTDWEKMRRRFDPHWTSPPAPRVTDEAFEWLGEDLAHPVVPLQPAVFLKRMRGWAAYMERILEREREAVRAELMGLRLRYSTLQQSVEMLHDYQEDVMQALEWQEENNIQEGDLLPLRDSSLPSDDD